jgi:hypothetical protein
MAPCDVKETTSPGMVLPTVNAATKRMKASGSLTAGGGDPLPFWRRACSDC